MSFVRSCVTFLKKYKAPILIFIASRLLIAFAVYFVNGYDLGGKNYAHLVRWDANNYLSIVNSGYRYNGMYAKGGELIAFFPLYPLLVRFTSVATGLSSAITGQLLSLFFGIASSILLYILISKWRNEHAATMGVFLLSFFPTSIFMSSVYTESLFLFLVLLTFYFWEQNKLVASIPTVALACVTRITGSIIGLVFTWHIWKKTKSILKVLLYGAIACIPFALFLYFQYKLYGNPFAFIEAQGKFWNNHRVFPWEGLYWEIKRTFFTSPKAFFWKFDLVYIAVMTLTLIISFKKVPRYVWWFGLGLIVLTLSSDIILSLGRYMFLMIPFYYYWGMYLSEKKYASMIVIAISTSWMILNTVVFSLQMNIF